MLIERQHFEDIYEKVVNKFIQDYRTTYRKQPNKTQIFGLRGMEQEKPDLAKALLTNPEVSVYLNAERLSGKSEKQLSITSDYLYKKSKRVEKSKRELGDNAKPDDKIGINDPYSVILFRYVGYENYQDFIQRREAANTVYDGYYYSYIKHEVCKYKLQVNYEVKPNIESAPHAQYAVSQEGYHDNGQNPLYTGYAYIRSKKLQLVMSDRQNEDRLRILLESGDNPESNEQMRGVIMAVASYNPNPITATETVIVKRGDSSVDERDILSIQRYLLLHQNNFRINTGTINLKMMASKRVSVDIMVPFIGIWETYRFGRNPNEIIQSYLWVKEDYRIVCFTAAYPDLPNFQEQVCLPDMTTYDLLNTRTIHLRTYPLQGANIISSSFFNIPNRGDTEIEGSISFVGRSNSGPTSRALLLIKDQKLTEADTSSEGDQKKSDIRLLIKEKLEQRNKNAFTNQSEIPNRLTKLEQKASVLWEDDESS